MLQGDFLSVLEAADQAEFRSAVIRFAQRLGFDTVGALTVVDKGRGDDEFITADNTPEAYRKIYAGASSGPRDPVMQKCKRLSIPIIRDQKTYLDRDAIDIWETQAPFGYRNGIAMALHLPEGRHFMFGVERDQA